MEAFSAGTLAGAGSFRCDSCGFAVALHERQFGKLHFETAKALLAYGTLLRDMGRIADAEMTLRRAIIPHAISGDWSTIEAVTTAITLGELVAYRNPLEARLFFSRAALGARLRVGSYRDHGTEARYESWRGRLTPENIRDLTEIYLELHTEQQSQTAAMVAVSAVAS